MGLFSRPDPPRDPGVPVVLGCSYTFERKVEGKWHSSHGCTGKNDGHTVHKCSCGESDDERNPR